MRQGRSRLSSAVLLRVKHPVCARIELHHNMTQIVHSQTEISSNRPHFAGKADVLSADTDQRKGLRLCDLLGAAVSAKQTFSCVSV